MPARQRTRVITKGVTEKKWWAEGHSYRPFEKDCIGAATEVVRITRGVGTKEQRESQDVDHRLQAVAQEEIYL